MEPGILLSMTAPTDLLAALVSLSTDAPVVESELTRSARAILEEMELGDEQDLPLDTDLGREIARLMAA